MSNRFNWVSLVSSFHVRFSRKLYFSYASWDKRTHTFLLVESQSMIRFNEKQHKFRDDEDVKFFCIAHKSEIRAEFLIFSGFFFSHIFLCCWSALPFHIRLSSCGGRSIQYVKLFWLKTVCNYTIALLVCPLVFHLRMSFWWSCIGYCT